MKAISPNKSFLIILILMIGFTAGSAYILPTGKAASATVMPKPTDTPLPTTQPTTIPAATPSPSLQLSSTIAAAGLKLQVGGTAQDLAFGLSDNTETKVKCVVQDVEDTESVVITAPDAPAVSYIVSVKANLRAVKGNPITLTCSNANGTINVLISEIEPQRTETDLTVDGLPGKPTELRILAKQTLTLTVAENVTLEKEEAGNALIDLPKGPGNTYLLRGNSRSGNAVNIVAKSSGVNIPINGLEKFPITVGDVVVKPNLSLVKDTPEDIEGPGKTVTIDPGFQPSIPLKYSSPENTLTILNRAPPTVPDPTIEGTASLFSKQVNIIGGTKFEPASFSVTVLNKDYSIKITPPSDNAVYINGGKLLLSAMVTDSDRNPADVPITWTIPNATDRQYITGLGTAQTILISALKVPSEPDNAITIRATVGEPGEANAKFDEIQVFVRGGRNVVDFRPIKVRIDMLDERTAKDLFGGRAEAEYHIAKIRIVNDLNVSQGGGAGNSVLFFSDALEVRVALEKKGTKNAIGGWSPVDEEDIYYINNWKTCKNESMQASYDRTLIEEGLSRCTLDYRDANRNCEKEHRGDLDAINRCKERAQDTLDRCEINVERDVRTGACDGDLDCLNRVRFCELLSVGEKSNEKSRRQSLNIQQNEPEQRKFPSGLTNLRSGQWIPFRPFIYQVVANTHDRRADRSLRSRIFLGANILGSGLSFFTSFLVPGPQSDLPLFLDKYQNFAIPTFEKLFPSLREVQRQNIISEILPPIVEVPFGSDVSKYVFFPKKDIEGVLPNQKVRITSISSYNISVKVGVVQKTTVQQTQ
jgi:hypothetical protein